MTTYRILWLSMCVSLGVIGVAVVVATSPVAAALLFIVFGLAGGRLPLSLGDGYWKRATVGRLRLLAGGALVAGTSAIAFIGHASLFGPGALLITAAVLAGSPSAVRSFSRWLRSVRTPSAAQLNAMAGARLPTPAPSSATSSRRSCVSSPTRTEQTRS